MVSLPPPGAARARGFTLAELMVGVAVAGILAALAAPSFTSLVANMRGRGAGSDLYAALVRARSEAIKLNKEVTLQPGASWQAGWNILNPVDTTVNLDSHAAVAGATITGPTSVVFLPNGRLKGGGTPQFDISVTGSAQRRCISLELSGRPHQTNGGC
jgi:type IV fimbrial biogenesis protein FimT